MARALLNNPVLEEAFIKLENDTIVAWRASKEIIQREQLHARMHAIELVKAELNATIKRFLRDEGPN